MQIVEIGERTRQIALDERQGASHRLDAHLDENARRVLDVVAGRLHESWRLTQLRQHPPRPFGRRRIREQGLTGEARRQDVGVKLRAPLPGPHHFELEHARPQVVGEHAMLEAFHRRERVLGDFVEPAEISGQGVNFTLDRVPTQILEMIVVRMDAIERRVGGMSLVKITQ